MVAHIDGEGFTQKARTVDVSIRAKKAVKESVAVLNRRSVCKSRRLQLGFPLAKPVSYFAEQDDFTIVDSAE